MDGDEFSHLPVIYLFQVLVDLTQRIFVNLLFLVLLIPGALLLLDCDKGKTCERRDLARKPVFGWSPLPVDSLDTYFKDHFALRNRLSHWNASLKYELFHSSAHPQLTQLGSDGWWFYTSREDGAYESRTQSKHLSKEEIASIATLLLDRKNQLQLQGIDYVAAVWPNKTSIYPEFQPWNLRVQTADGPNKATRVNQALSERNTDWRILEVQDELRARSERVQTYHKIDTHWNKVGAHCAYTQLMLWLGKKPLALGNFAPTDSVNRDGDLKALAGLCNHPNIQDWQPRLVDQLDPDSFFTQEYDRCLIVEQANATHTETILVFRESFTSALVPLIARHYSKAIFIWEGYHPKWVEKFQPNVILDAKVERYF